MDLLLSKKKRFKGVKTFFLVSVNTGSKKIKSKRTKANVLIEIKKNRFDFETGGSVNL
jgi:hypothetical protein